MRNKWIFLFLSLTVFPPCFSQKIEENKPINLENYTTKDGLSQSTVFAMTQDHEGYMWFGTRKGLNRFDGYDFSIFKTDKEDSSSISQNFIRSLFVDSRGILWVGTTGGGLNQYNNVSNDFKRYKHDPADINSLTQDDVFSVAEDSVGNLWIGTNYGISILNPKTGEFIKMDPASPLQEVQTKSIRSLLFDNDQNLWIGSTNGLSRYDFSGQKIYHYHRDPSLHSSIKGNIISTTIQDSNSRIWIGTEDGGLSKYNPSSESFSNYLFDPNDPHSLRNNVVRDIHEDEYGNFWVATDGGGINIFDPENGEFFTVSGVSEYFDELPRAIIKFYPDNSGNLWISSYGTGVFKFNSNKNTILNFRRQSNSNSLSHSSVLALIEDQNKNILIGTDGGGLNIFSPKDNYSFTVLQHISGNKNSLSSNVIKSIAEDSKGQIWMGTFNAGLIEYDPKSKNFKTYYNDPNNSLSIPNNSVWDILKDHNQNMWFATQIGGVCFMEANKQGDFHLYTKIKNDTSSLSNYPLNVIYEDKNFEIWLGTESSGLFRFDSLTKSFIGYQNDPLDSTSISNNGVQALFEDSKGRFWVGTDGGGLNLMDRTTGKFQQKSDLVKAETIFDLLEDRNGNLWISTDAGIFCVFSDERRVIRYNINDGVQGKEFNFNSATIDSNGLLYFGGLNGFNVIDPEILTSVPSETHLVFTDFLLFNQVQKPTNLGPLFKQIGQTDKISLKYIQNNFTLKFTAFEFSKTKNTQYAYQLEGYDTGWNYLGEKRFINFMNIDPGDYILRIKCTNNLGQWSQDEISLAIEIYPPWWATWWLKTLAILLIVTIVYFIYLFKVKSLKRQEKKLKAEVKVRTEEIVVQNEEIRFQKESIERKNQELVSAQELIDEKNKELLEANLNLEKIVESRTSELQVAYKKLFQTTKEYDQFVYRSAHDLKGPLARLKGICYLARRDYLNEDKLQYFDLMDKVSVEMETILDRLTRIHEINERDISRKEIYLKKFISDLVEECLQGNSGETINFILDIPNKMKYATDEFLFKILLKNLIDNAIQFKDPAINNQMVEISVKNKKGKLEILIRDNGRGINNLFVHQIFDMFVVASEDSKGFGLGLYESKMIVEKLDGQIKLLDSTQGNTQFLVRVG